jgi:hypothetical protein
MKAILLSIRPEHALNILSIRMGKGKLKKGDD